MARSESGEDEVTDQFDLAAGEGVFVQSPGDGSSRFSRRDFLVVLAATSVACTSGAASSAPLISPDQRETCLDDGWRFYRGSLQGGEAVGFDDAAWRGVDLPHDWGVEDLPYANSDSGVASTDPASWATPNAPQVIGPFDKSIGDRSHGYMVGGEGWYRRRFTLEHALHDLEIELRLDGVFQNADVWLNGAHVAFHPCGYTPALVSLTSRAHQGTNVIAVRVRNLGSTSRWYPGSGIYRHTWLTVTRAVRLPTFGVRITTTEIAAEHALVRIEVDAENKGIADAAVAVDAAVVGGDGRTVVRGTARTAAIAAGGRSTFILVLRVPKPRLWSPSTPHLYSAQVALVNGQMAIDRVAQNFGIRSISFDGRGFRLNGNALKMQGGCVHSQHGALGAASFDVAEERRVRILKENGFNAVRTAHNPPSPAFLDACDRLGMLVYAEAFDMWDQAKRLDDYHVYFPEWFQRDLDMFIARDRNHPSVVVWSTGNEIMEANERASEIAQRVRILDPSRPVTQSAAMGMADLIEPVLTGEVWRYLDVGDVHYQLSYEALHKAQPNRAVIQSESWVANVYDNWKAIEDNECAAGDFVWTAWDYLGETGVGAARVVKIGAPALTLKEAFPNVDYPWFQSYCGDIDLIGQPKPQSWYRRVVWGDRLLEVVVERPVPEGMEQRAHMWSWFDELKSWTWNVEPGHVMRVKAYTSGDEVLLMLNGAQVGSKHLTAADKCIATFEVPYTPGVLSAVARSAGRNIASQTIETVGAAAELRLAMEPEALHAARGSIAHVLVQVVDSKGRPMPDAVVRVGFEVSGEAQIVAIANANPRNVDSFRRLYHYTYHGQVQVVLRSTGKAGIVHLRAHALGLNSSELTIVVATSTRQLRAASLPGEDDGTW